MIFEWLIGFGVLFLFGIIALVVRCYRKVGPEEALVRSGYRGLEVRTGRGLLVYPILHRIEQMDLSVKRIEIARRGEAV